MSVQRAKAINEKLEAIKKEAEKQIPVAPVYNDGIGYPKDWWELLAKDCDYVIDNLARGIIDLDDADQEILCLEGDLKDGLKWMAEDLKKRFGLSDDSSADDCSCSTRDLFTFGHKCGRKAPIDKR